ncbi:MAG: hypothetical protein ACTTKN_03005 [Phocaeicola sp.]|uniref:hypothetical protein n=1 Tax=Phocaeicola TaxID=909656 RepID=UPI00234EA608|nr:hypothetical protein [Phocaeicola oris]MCE2616676.1 hypothetical protein [Phocaeicola oris]
MIETLLITLLIVAICFGLLGIGVWIKGKFPNFHVDGNKALNDQGIRCVEAQDQEARAENQHAIAEREC